MQGEKLPDAAFARAHPHPALRATFSHMGEGNPSLDLRKLARLLTGATEPAMPTEPKKPLIVISYAHADEPERPAEGEVKWLSFVTGYLRPAIKHGAVDLWLDRLMPGGADWEPEIEQKLRDCDIFILLVSPNSLASDYVIKKEIAIIRERQAKGEDMHFYPLLLTPTPNIALDLMREKNLRPRGGKPFSDYSLHDRDRHMSETADAIAQIAAEIVARKRAPWRSPPAAPLARLSSAPPPSPRQRADKRRRAKPEINDQESLEAWLEGQSLEVAATIAARTALRVAPLTFRDARKARSAKEVSAFLVLTSVVFRASALARVAAKYPARANELSAAALVAAALAAPFAIPLAAPARPSFPAAWAAADWAVREEMWLRCLRAAKARRRRVGGLPPLVAERRGVGRGRLGRSKARAPRG